MENYKQYINYKLVPKAGGKTDKLPVSPHTGRVCNAHNPAEWVSRAEAGATGLPVAFVFTEADPFFFLDIDGAYGPSGWSKTATDLCTMFAGCAVEISQSGKGLHIFGTTPESMEHGKKNMAEGLELYTSGRFVALTGSGLTGSAEHVPPVETYRAMINTWFPPNAPGVAGEPAEWTEAPCPEWSGPADDADLIKRMLASKSAKGALGGTATIKQLWGADGDALSRIFPDGGGQMRAFDWSQADAALCSHLSFWTGKDCARIGRLFGQSALADRDKWRDREEYRINTILGAVGKCDNVYKQRGAQMPDVSAVPGIRAGYQLAGPQEQVEMFAGCVYVQDEHKVFTPNGLLLKPEQFRAMYGGYSFILDSEGDKTTKNAWEVFTESQALTFPKVHSTCFRPECAPGSIIKEDSLDIVNVYVPFVTNRIAGDPGPFLDLIARLLPVKTDREILLAYMAACVQYPGRKFQWCPLIQGAPGNGKTLIGHALIYAMGRRYSHLPEAKDIGNKFNAWLSEKLLIVVEEICTKDKLDNAETLKWMITNEIVPLQRKGCDQKTGDNRANFIMFSNHKDAIQKTESDRRFCVFYTAQQAPGDFTRDGMAGDYFPKLWQWAKADGWAIINEYLHTYQIPAALNPAGLCQRAPETSSTNEALIVSMGYIEQEIMEAIEEERTGFMGGWISSMKLDAFLRNRNIPLSNVHKKEILKNLGYIPHPALPGGRVNNVVPLENGKPRLYIKRGHLATNINRPVEVARIYSEKQGYLAPAMGGAMGVMEK
jgi:hypothetical protein